MESCGTYNTGNTPARVSALPPPAPCPGIGRVLRLEELVADDWWLVVGYAELIGMLPTPDAYF